MKKQLVIIGTVFLLISLVALGGCMGEEDNTPSESERLVGTWGEMSYDATSGTEIKISDVTFYKNGTGISHPSYDFPETFNYSISNGKITITQPGLEESPTTYDYYFSDSYNTLNIKNTFGGTTTVYKKQ